MNSRSPLFPLLAACALIRFALIPLNTAEYTDGILLLTQFERPTGIWPPLYTMLCWPMKHVVGPLWAGRLVSAACSSLALIPLWRLARRYFGSEAATWCGVLYILAPTALRWAPRVMSDATFSLFFWWSSERLLAACGTDDARDSAKAFVMGCLAAGLAAFTRYQGMMLIVPALVVAAHGLHLKRIAPAKLLALAAFAAAPAWMAYVGTIHGEQFADRSGGGMARTLSVLVGNAEPFLLFMPYFLGYPVAALALYGLLKPPAPPRAPLLAFTAFTAVTLLIAQSLFSSFQERYFLPLFGLLLVFAGGGAALLADALRRRAPRVLPYALGLPVLWSVALSAAVLWGSRDAWGDVRRASQRNAETSFGNTTWTNDFYREGIECDKVKFFSYSMPHDKPIITKGTPSFEFITPDVLSGARPMGEGNRVLIVGIAGGEEYERQLLARYPLEFMFEERAMVIPIFPDLMSGYPGSQNPLAWHSRYSPQVFWTRVYKVK